MIVPPDFLLAHPDLLSSLPDRPACLLLRPEACCADAAAVLRRTMPMSTDALSEVLSAVHLTGSVFFDVTAKSPWVAEAPPAAQIAHQVTPGAQHVMEYHVVTRGSCWISLVGDAEFEPVRLAEGDIAVIPHGDPHVVSSAPGMRAKPDLDLHRRPEDDNALPFTLRSGGDGPSDAHLICGFFSCDVRPFNPLLASLPRFMRFGRDASSGSDNLLSQFIHFATAETANKRVAHGSACAQQHRLARRIAGSSGRARSDTVACTAFPRLDTGGTRLGDWRIALGARRSICPFGGLSADSISNPVAYADGRQASHRSGRQGFSCRL